MLKYTGHPLVDVGVATITAFADKSDPAALTEADLDRMADYITQEYTRQPLKSFLTVAFPNSGFTQPAYEKMPEKRLDYAQRVLRGYHTDAPMLDEICVFTGEPAVAIAFGDKDDLPLGRAFRQHIPLLTGEGVINFHPYGDAGLPVSGKAILAMQAFPLGCAKCAGRLLAVHSDDTDIIFRFAAEFLQRNRDTILRAQLEGSSKMPETQYSHRSLLVDTLLKIQKGGGTASLTAYHLSNSGQGPGLDIHHLPMQITGFLQAMQRAGYHQTAWNEMVRRAWEVAPVKKGRPDPDFKPRRNWLYEDLFDLPDAAPRFIRTYFLRSALRYARGETDPRRGYSLQQEADLVSWKVTAPFLRRVLGMDKERVEEIRNLADRLANYVNSQNDRRFFREFYLVQRYSDFRDNLIKATVAYAKQGHAPLVGFDPYIAIFEEGTELARADWRLARDLVLIRMIEQLHAQGWLGRNADAIPEPQKADVEPETEAAA